MADAAGLNPATPQGVWGFESLLRHHQPERWTVAASAAVGARLVAGWAASSALLGL
jgi:hypothetical protein